MTAQSDAAIRAAIDTALAAVSGFPDTDHRATENASYEPTIGDPWVRVSYFWGTETLTTLPASGGSLWKVGLIRVSLFTPLVQGPDAADTLAQAIRDAFPSLHAIATLGGQALQVSGSRRWDGQRDPEGAWWHVPVDITWKLKAVNPQT